MSIDLIKEELGQLAQVEKAEFYPKYFKAYRGGYGEGDQFIGVTVPNMREIAKRYQMLSNQEVERLLHSSIHEHRATALLIWTYKYPKADEAIKDEIIDLYLKNLEYVNNWDLVDLSSYKILGPHLENGDRSVLYNLARTNHLWSQRVAMITTMHFIRKREYEDTLAIASLLMDHSHDLIHKAVGWMLREVGNKSKETEEEFLKNHYKNMPRTMLRYAIEKFSKEERQAYLKGLI